MRSFNDKTREEAVLEDQEEESFMLTQIFWIMLNLSPSKLILF